MYGLIFLEEANLETFADFTNDTFQYSYVIEKSRYLQEVKTFRAMIDFDAQRNEICSLDTIFDVYCPTTQNVQVNGRDITLCPKTWTSEVEEIAVRCIKAKKAKHIFFVNEKSKGERNFAKYCVAAVHSPHHNITLFTGCIIVAKADPSKPVYVCVRIYSIYGSCNDLDVILYDIEGMSLNMRKINEGVRDGISMLKRGNYCVNLHLVGTKIDYYKDTAESLYLKHMEENLLHPHLHTYLRLKSTCVDPFQAKENINCRDILPDEVEHDPTYSLYDAERDDTEVIKVAITQVTQKGINPYSEKEKIPELTAGKTCDDNVDSNSDNDGPCLSKRTKSKRISQRSSAKKCTDNVDCDSDNDGTCVSKKTKSKKIPQRTNVEKGTVQESTSKCGRSNKSTAKVQCEKPVKTQSNTNISYSEAQMDDVVAKSTKLVEERYKDALIQMESQLEQQKRQLEQLMKQQSTNRADDTEGNAKATKNRKKRKNEKEEKLKKKMKSAKLHDSSDSSENESSDDDDSSDDCSSCDSSDKDEDADLLRMMKKFMKQRRSSKKRRKYKERKHKRTHQNAKQVIINEFKS